MKKYKLTYPEKYTGTIAEAVAQDLVDKLNKARNIAQQEDIYKTPLAIVLPDSFKIVWDVS